MIDQEVLERFLGLRLEHLATIKSSDRFYYDRIYYGWQYLADRALTHVKDSEIHELAYMFLVISHLPGWGASKAWKNLVAEGRRILAELKERE